MGFNITSVVTCASEEYVERESVFAATDDDDGNDGAFQPGAIRSDDTAVEENYED